MYLHIKRATMALLLSLFCFAGYAQQTVSGTVKDASGEPMIGVTVLMDGQPAAITDLDGNFTIQNAKPSSVIKVTYVGYTDQQFTVGNKSRIDVNMKEDNQALDEVVVVGYGTMKKRDLTGSVGSVKAEEMAKVASANALQAMQGKVAGVDLTQSSGEAGAGVNITLRGNRSITATNSPLILVDGVEYGSTLDINPNDIESMDILKDAASTAIYGTKGANGVIIITTKHGKAGKTKINFNAYVSVNTATHIPKVMTGMTEINRRIAAKNYAADKANVDAFNALSPEDQQAYLDGHDGIAPFYGQSAFTPEDVLSGTPTSNQPYSELDIYESGSYTDWLDQVIKTGTTQNYDISASGGSDKTTYSTSLSMMIDNGILRNDKMKRYNGKIIVDHTFNKYVKAGMNMLFTYKDQDKRDTGVFSQGLKMTSIARPRIIQSDIDNGFTQGGLIPSVGDLILKPSPTYEAHANPMLDEVSGAYQHSIEGTRLFGNTYLEVMPLPGLTFKTMFALDRKSTRTGIYSDYQSVGNLQSANGGTITQSHEYKTGWTWENTLNYTKTFNKIHDLTVLLGHHMDKSITEYEITSGRTANEHYYTSAWRDARNIISPVLDNTYVKTTMLSFFGRVNYALMDRYLFQASLRADGSSRLAKGHKWGYFPSASIGWRISEESFMAPTRDWLSNLKIRASWGLSGNAAVEPYQTLATLSNWLTYYSFGGKTYTGKVPNSVANEELTWEKTSAFNLGLDFGFFKNRINGSVELYWSKTKDLLYYQSLPGSSVFPTAIGNIGNTSGHGVEVTINAQPIVKKDFTWDINFQATFMRDKVTSLSDGVTRNINGRTGQIVGEPVNIYYDYEQNGGCWQPGEYEQYVQAFADRHEGAEPTFRNDCSSYGTPGTIKIVDQNDDGKLDDNDKRVYNRTPKAIFGMTNSFTYKDFSLSFQMYARLGGYFSYDFNSRLTYDNANQVDLDYWTPVNTGAKFPSLGADKAPWTNYGTATYYEKADFFKIKDITLAYNLPSKVIKKIGLNRLRLYASMKNYITFSKVDNYDPERGGSISFPLTKQMVFGVNVEF